MKNKYKIVGEVAYIEVNCKGETYVALMDAEDIHLLENRKLRFVCDRYLGFNRDKIRYKIHRLVTNAPSDKVVDHLNGNPLDNRKENLRICTQKDNMNNPNNKRKVKDTGVYKHGNTGKFVVRIYEGKNARAKYYGIYDTYEKALNKRNEVLKNGSLQ